MPKESNVIALPAAVGVPDLPAGLGVDGRRLWEQIWTAGAIWISPQTDSLAVQLACETADALAIARERFGERKATAQDGRLVVALSKEFRDTLSALGFDPTARTRLGVAEVKKASAIDQLLERRDQRSASVADAGQRRGGSAR